MCSESLWTICSATGVTTSQHQPGSLPVSSPQGKWDELLAPLVLNGLADICRWQQAGSKNMLTTGLAHVSNVANAEAQMSNDVWLLGAPLFCHLYSVARLPWNKQLQAARSSWYTTGGYCVLPVCWMSASCPKNPLKCLDWYKNLKQCVVWHEKILKTHMIYWPLGIKINLLVLAWLMGLNLTSLNARSWT